CDYRRTGTGGVSVERGTGRCRPTANKKNPVLSAANTPPVPVRMWSEHAFHISPAAVSRTRHGGRIFVPLLQKVKRIIVFEEMHQLISTHDRNILFPQNPGDLLPVCQHHLNLLAFLHILAADRS